MAVLNVNGYRLFYEAKISDRCLPTILFIHTVTMDSSEWIPVTRLLGSGVNYVTFDSSGHGKSETSGKPLTFDQLVSEALTLMNHLKLDSVHLAGDGIGGNIGFALALKVPCRISSLTLFATNFYYSSKEHIRPLTFLRQMIDIDRKLLTQKLLTDNFYSLTCEKAVRFVKAFRKVPARVIKEMCTAVRDRFDPAHFSLESELGRLKVPVLIVQGSNDPVLRSELAAIFATYIPGCRFLMVPEAGHLMPLDQPEFAARFLSRFVRSRKDPNPALPVCRTMMSGFRNTLHLALTQRTVPHHLLQINVMRDVQVTWNGEVIDGAWNQRGAKELLLYLVLHCGAATREALIHTFMPDLPAGAARNDLRVRINHLANIFRQFHRPDVHDLLLNGEDTVALNAEVESDIGNYLDELTKFQTEACNLSDAALHFINLLKTYTPANFSSFRGDWIFTITDRIESRLAEILQELLPMMMAGKMYALLCEMLQYSRAIEPYDGFCDEKLVEFRTMNSKDESA